MIRLFMGRCVKLWNERPKVESGAQLQLRWPVEDAMKKIYEPLEYNIIADGDNEEVGGVDSGSKNIVDISIAKMILAVDTP